MVMLRTLDRPDGLDRTEKNARSLTAVGMTSVPAAAKAEQFSAQYGTTPQPSARKLASGLNAKSCPDTCMVTRKRVGRVTEAVLPLEMGEQKKYFSSFYVRAIK